MRFPLRHDRWVFAAAAFVAGVVLAAAAIGAGVRVAIGGRDFTLVAALLLEAGLALAGFVIGRGVEARVAEEREQAVARRTLEEMSVLQARLADRQRLAAIGELGATVAHEIRNPLAIIRTMVQNLADSASGTPDVRRTSEALLEEIDRVSRVTTALSGLSRPPVPRVAPIASDVVLTRVEWLARRLLHGREISLRVRDVGSPVRLLGDPDLLCQVLLELVANAAAATPQGGEISLESRAAGDVVILTVRDQGPGIPPETREQIFDPFFSSRAGGTGIGLAVARQIVRSQGGTIFAATAEAGAGATFEIRLPAAVEP
jgi:signal transduction histidine kinase